MLTCDAKPVSHTHMGMRVALTGTCRKPESLENEWFRGIQPVWHDSCLAINMKNYNSTKEVTDE